MVNLPVALGTNVTSDHFECKFSTSRCVLHPLTRCLSINVSAMPGQYLHPLAMDFLQLVPD